MTELAHKQPLRRGTIWRPGVAQPVRLAGVLWVLCGLLAAGCGGGAAPLSQADSHRLFGEMQVHEARQDEASRRLSSVETCPSRCEAHTEIEREAEHICELAERLRDADALLRCRAARDHVPASPPADCSCAESTG